MSGFFIAISNKRIQFPTTISPVLNLLAGTFFNKHPALQRLGELGKMISGRTVACEMLQGSFPQHLKFLEFHWLCSHTTHARKVTHTHISI